MINAIRYSIFRGCFFRLKLAEISYFRAWLNLRVVKKCVRVVKKCVRVVENLLRVVKKGLRVVENGGKICQK